MGVAYYVLLEDGVQPEMDGKALARYSKRLPSLETFLQIPTGQLAELMDEEAPETDYENLQWFSPEVGLALVEGYLVQHPEPVELRADLQSLHQAMELAQRRYTRWHLRIDI